MSGLLGTSSTYIHPGLIDFVVRLNNNNMNGRPSEAGTPNSAIEQLFLFNQLPGCRQDFPVPPFVNPPLLPCQISPPHTVHGAVGNRPTDKDKDRNGTDTSGSASITYFCTCMRCTGELPSFLPRGHPSLLHGCQRPGNRPNFLIMLKVLSVEGITAFMYIRKP